MRWLIVTFLCLLALIALQACGAPPEPQGTGISLGVTRYVDEEAGVTCWIFDGYHEGGIDCLPSEETSLDTGGEGG